MAQRLLRAARTASKLQRVAAAHRLTSLRLLSGCRARLNQAVDQPVDVDATATPFTLPADLSPIEFVHREQRPVLSFDETIKVLRACAVHQVTFEAHIKVTMHDKTRKRGRPRDPIRGVFVLPHGFKEARKIVVLAVGGEVDTALAAGAIAAGGEDLLEQITDGKLAFDLVMATPAALKEYKSQAGRVLRTQMPTAKKGTVVEDLETELPRIARGISIRSDVSGAIPIAFGKLDMRNEDLRDNLDSVIKQVLVYNIGIKNRFIERVTVTTSNGPGFMVQLDDIVTPLL